MKRLLLLLAVVTGVARAETSGFGGRGGPFISYHSNPVTGFDAEVTGNPVFIGGMGFGQINKQIRLGGGGAASFLLGPSENVHFGLGYGGAVGEYVFTPWLSARLMIGGGGYAVAKVVSETETQRVVQKLSSGGFILFYPSLTAELPLYNWLRLGMNLGYFLPNVGRLQSVTFGVSVMFGKL